MTTADLVKPADPSLARARAQGAVVRALLDVLESIPPSSPAAAGLLAQLEEEQSLLARLERAPR